MSNNSLRRKYWLWAAGWVALIYSTLSIVRPVCEFLKKTTPLNVLTNVGLVMCFVFLITQAVSRRWIRRGSTWILFAGAAAVYAVLALRLPSPEERLHFLEYGVLVFLIYRALRLDVSLAGLTCSRLFSHLCWDGEMKGFRKFYRTVIFSGRMSGLTAKVHY